MDTHSRTVGKRVTMRVFNSHFQQAINSSPAASWNHNFPPFFYVWGYRSSTLWTQMNADNIHDRCKVEIPFLQNTSPDWLKLQRLLKQSSQSKQLNFVYFKRLTAFPFFKDDAQQMRQNAVNKYTDSSSKSIGTQRIEMHTHTTYMAPLCWLTSIRWHLSQVQIRFGL